MVESVGRNKSGRSSADNAHFLTVAFGLFYTYIILLKCMFGNGTFIFAVGCRFVLNKV